MLLEISQRLGVHPNAMLGRVLQTKDGEVEVTDEMVEAVTVFLEEIKALPEKTSVIELSMSSTSVEGLRGTADYVNQEGNVLHVYDYKHGAGVAVEAENNLQLLTYAGLAMEHFGREFDAVVLKIIQPRAQSYGGDEAPKVKRWTVSPAQVKEHMAAVKAVAEIARSEDAPLVPGDHCRWCPAKPQCPKLHQLAVSEAKADFRLPSPVELDEQKLLFWLDMGPILKDWLKSVEEHAKRHAESAGLPGWKVVESVGNRRWAGTDEEIAIHLVNEGFHPDDVWQPRELKSPSQMEKVRPEGMKVKEAKALLDEHTVRPVTGTTLVREADRRPAITNNAANDFTRIES